MDQRFHAEIIPAHMLIMKTAAADAHGIVVDIGFMHHLLCPFPYAAESDESNSAQNTAEKLLRIHSIHWPAVTRLKSSS